MDRLNYRFRDATLLARALTHKSTGRANNERLEFLGDRVLGLCIAAVLYKKFPHETEGTLAIRHASLVSARSLAAIAENIGLGAELVLSPQEERRGGRINTNILADTLEAVFAAVFLDGGFDAASTVAAELFSASLDDAANSEKDAKTALQELTQKRFGQAPTYEIVNREGPDHKPTFTVRAAVRSSRAGNAEADAAGPSLGAAETAAAKKLLEILG